MKHLVRLLSAVVLAPLLLACATSVASPQGWAAPVQSGSTVLIETEPGTLTALEVGDSAATARWSYPADKDDEKLGALYATPLVQEGRVYVVGYSGVVMALDLATGRPVVGWAGAKLKDERFIGTPALDRDGRRLYAVTEDGDVHTIELATGLVTPTLARIDDRVWSAPVLSGSTLYVGSLDRRMVTVDAASGALTEHARFGVAGDLVIDGGEVLVAGFDRRVHAISLATADEVWASEPSRSWFWPRPLVDRGTVYVADVAGIAVALDRASGVERWHSVPAPEDRGEVRAMPVLSKDVLVIATRDGWLTGLDPGTGAELWARQTLQGALLADPLVLESGILYATEQGSLLRVAPATGEVETLFVRSSDG